MNPFAALDADLRDLVLDLEERGYTRSVLAMLHRNLVAAVPSALGYAVRLVLDPSLPAVGMVVTDGPLEPGAVRSSLAVTLPTRQPTIPASAILYAGTPHAFTELTAHLSSESVRSRGVVVVPAGAASERIVPGLSGLADLTVINRALGVLLERGLTLTEGRSRIQAQADAQHTSLTAVAQAILDPFTGGSRS